MKKGNPIIRYLYRRGLMPPKSWRYPAIFFFAAMISMAAFLVKISNASSYLSDDPQACVNCHIMTPQYITWSNSSHREVASCNDCHVPQNNIANKYLFKAKDGLYHASVFTARAEPEVIQAREASIEVIQNNCIRCHKDQVTDAKLTSWVANHQELRTDRTCWECHRDVPHGKVRSLSAVGYQIEPIKTHSPKDLSIVPDWLKKEMQSNNDSIQNTK